MTRITPVFQPLTPVVEKIPLQRPWFLNQSVGGVPEDAVPAMLASGYEVTWAMPGMFGEPTTYGLRKSRMLNQNVVLDLLESFTRSYNEGRMANEKRYVDIIKNYNEMLDKSQTELDNEQAEVGGEIVVHMTTLNDLESQYDKFFVDVKNDLDGLDLTMDADRQRVRDQFDSLIAAEGQKLSSRGFFSSALLSSINAGIEERRALALTEISERLQRLRADLFLRKNQVYIDVLKMRAGLIESKIGLSDRRQAFMKYRMDERNKLLVGLFGFVERREDSYPGLGAMAQVTASLGESGGSAWRSG